MGVTVPRACLLVPRGCWDVLHYAGRPECNDSAGGQATARHRAGRWNGTAAYTGAVWYLEVKLAGDLT